MSDRTACETLVNKTGDVISVGLKNDHTIETGTVVGFFGDTLLLNDVTIRVGANVFDVGFYWVDCDEIAWFN